MHSSFRLVSPSSGSLPPWQDLELVNWNCGAVLFTQPASKASCFFPRPNCPAILLPLVGSGHYRCSCSLPSGRDRAFLATILSSKSSSFARRAASNLAGKTRRARCCSEALCSAAARANQLRLFPEAPRRGRRAVTQACLAFRGCLRWKLISRRASDKGPARRRLAFR